MGTNSILDQKVKEMAINNLSGKDKKEYRLKTVENIFSQLSDRENRYIFYCPDMPMVNNLVKLIYETAYEVEQLGYSVLILHEINGFRCKWLFELEQYKHLKELKVDYIIKKTSKKSKKQKANYSFKPSDTLIVPDQFQEMIDNLAEVKLIQKVVLVSSYAGISSLAPGMDYASLGIKKLLFIEAKLKEDYEILFNIEGLLIDKYPINVDVFKKRENVKEIYPTICISNIGNNELTQEVINVFHAKYPHLRTFGFKILPRDSFETYIDCFNHCALLLVLDNQMGNNQMIFEAMEMGIPIGTIQRRESEGPLLENIFFGHNAFEIADSLAGFCSNWLSMSTSTISNFVNESATSMNIEEYSYENYSNQLRIAFEEIQMDRVKYFSSIKHSIESQVVASEQ
jgi:hypothetical protein